MEEEVKDIRVSKDRRDFYVYRYVEPKVVWVNEHEDGYYTAHNTEEKAKHSARYSRIIRIAVKYVEVQE